MVTALFYDHTEAQSSIAAAVVKNKWNNVVIKDTAGLNEASIDALIATLAATTYHRIYILVGVAGGHVTGDFTTAQVTATNAKLIGLLTDPESDDTCRERGVNSGTITPSLRTWNDIYSGISPAPIITYLGDISKFARMYGTATGGGATTVVDAGAPFTIDANIGDYVCIMAGTGIGDYAKITDNTTTTLTVAAWNKDSGVSITNPAAGATYCVYHSNHLARVLANVYLPYAILTYLAYVANGTVFEKWQQLLDYYQNLDTSGSTSASWDEELYQEILTAGKAVFDYTNR